MILPSSLWSPFASPGAGMSSNTTERCPTHPQSGVTDAFLRAGSDNVCGAARNQKRARNCGGLGRPPQPAAFRLYSYLTDVSDIARSVKCRRQSIPQLSVGTNARLAHPRNTSLWPGARRGWFAPSQPRCNPLPFQAPVRSAPHIYNTDQGSTHHEYSIRTHHQG
jgi:hypothetical protein